MIEYKERLIDQIKKHNSAVYLTVGFRRKNPTTMDKPMTSAEAIEWVRSSSGHYAKVELKERQGKRTLTLQTICDNKTKEGLIWVIEQ